LARVGVECHLFDGPYLTGNTRDWLIPVFITVVWPDRVVEFYGSLKVGLVALGAY
jgi:hypothetical protein